MATTTTPETNPLHELKCLPWPDLGLEGKPEHIAAFHSAVRERWRDVVRAFNVRIGLLRRAGRGDESPLRALEPAAAQIDQLLGEIAQETGVRLPPDLFARAAREASPLIPQLLGALALAGLLLAQAVVETIKAEYGDDTDWFLYGPPREAGAWRALFEDGDVRHFLRVFGNAGELGLAEHLAGYEFPVEELEAEVRAGDWLDTTFPELHEWRDSTVQAAYTVAEYMAREKSGDPWAQAVAGLSPGELLQFARADKVPRGFAGGDEAIYRHIENARKRARRRVDRLRKEPQGLPPGPGIGELAP